MSLDFDFVLIYWPFYIGEILDEHHRRLEFSNKYPAVDSFVKSLHDIYLLSFFVMTMLSGYSS